MFDSLLAIQLIRSENMFFPTSPVSSERGNFGEELFLQAEVNGGATTSGRGGAGPAERHEYPTFDAFLHVIVESQRHLGH